MVSSALDGCIDRGSTQHSSRAQGLILITSGGSTPVGTQPRSMHACERTHARTQKDAPDLCEPPLTYVQAQNERYSRRFELFLLPPAQNKRPVLRK